jgi:hypothetical protein
MDCGPAPSIAISVADNVVRPPESLAVNLGPKPHRLRSRHISNAVRYSYRVHDLVAQFDVKPAEIRALFNNQLDPIRSAELRDRMRAAGLPI